VKTAEPQRNLGHWQAIGYYGSVNTAMVATELVAEPYTF